jgi:membrane-bound acyltransferase YfiQ involved in biofilm formation
MHISILILLLFRSNIVKTKINLINSTNWSIHVRLVKQESYEVFYSAQLCGSTVVLLVFYMGKMVIFSNKLFGKFPPAAHSAEMQPIHIFHFLY